MPDTNTALDAIRKAYGLHTGVKSGLSDAEMRLIRMQGKLLPADLKPGDVDLDDPERTAQVLVKLKQALDACDQLQDAIIAAFNETGKLLPALTVTISKAAGVGVSLNHDRPPSATCIRQWLDRHGWKATSSGPAGSTYLPPADNATPVGIPYGDDDLELLTAAVKRIAARAGRPEADVAREMRTPLRSDDDG